MPTVDIMMPTFNAERTIAEAIEGVLNQTHEDFILHIRDDASLDATWEIISDYSKKDILIKAGRNKTNLGVAANCNLILESCSSNFLCGTAGDDVMFRDKLMVQLAHFESEPSLCLSFHNYEIRNLGGRLLGNSKLPLGKFSMLDLHKIPFPTVSVLAKWDPQKKYRYNHSFPLSDVGFFVDLWLGEGGSVEFLDQTLLRYQKTGSGLNFDRRKKDYGARMRETVGQQIGHCLALQDKYPDKKKMLQKRAARLTAHLRKSDSSFLFKVSCFIKATRLRWDWML